MLLAGRVIQGIGGGGLIILSNICITDLFSMRFVAPDLISIVLSETFAASKLISWGKHSGFPLSNAHLALSALN